ncbi:Hemolysin-type calcium-binding repeat protein VCBS [Sphingomonas paucimobilis]|nr:Hemolysin-type calcium-binding repeat protein VCBS [Sphingomonas paucimobilis]
MTITTKLQSNEMFLQGKYLNIGLNSTGTLGTKSIAPSGIYTNIDIGFNRLGMWADFDSFGAGKAPTVQEAVLKGTGVEGYSIGYKVGGNQIVRTNHERAGLISFTGVTKDLSTSGVAAAGWTGVTSENVKISQTTTLADDAKFIKVSVTVTNQSSSTLNDVRYMRTVDPDQGADFTTSNTIVSQAGASGALVAAYNGTTSPLFFYAKDARAVVSTFGFENTNPYVDAAYAKPQATNYVLKGDYAINLEYALGALGAGQSTSFTYYMGLTDNLSTTITAIDKGVVSPAPTPAPSTNTAPVATGDAVSGLAGATLIGDVLANDKDADGDALTAVVKSGPANGTLLLEANGDFRYTPKAGFSGTDSFVYTASDGHTAVSATVKLTVLAPQPPTPAPTPVPTPTPAPAPSLPNDAILTRTGTIDGSNPLNQILTGPDYHNSFFVNSAATTGNDRVTNFGHDDVLVTTLKVLGADGDGIIALDRTRVALDGPTGTDAIRLTDVSEIRSLGRTETGLFAYADASVRPHGAIEAMLGDSRLTGDLGDRVQDIFFFDTALDVDLGNDRIVNFGRLDKIVTTSALEDGNGDGIVMFGSDKLLDLPGGIGGPGDHSMSIDDGTVAITGLSGATVSALHFDGMTLQNGVHYYSYSLLG